MGAHLEFSGISRCQGHAVGSMTGLRGPRPPTGSWVAWGTWSCPQGITVASMMAEVAMGGFGSETSVPGSRPQGEQ